jgi:chloramphenicol 3-O phosphotransferase
MADLDGAGQIVILNGPPRSGKSSVAAGIQRIFDGIWMNLGVDGFRRMTPEWFQPGSGSDPAGSGRTSSR